MRWMVLLCAASMLVGTARALAKDGPDYSDQDLSKRDLSNKNLEKANFENADLIETNLEGIIAIGANFSGADLSSANLRDADLSNADLRKAKLKNPSTWGANMTGANLEGQDLSLVLLGRVKLRNANLRNLKAIGTCETCDFRGADLSGANLTAMTDYAVQTSKFRGATFDKATRFPKGFDPEAQEMVSAAAKPAPKVATDADEKPAPAKRIIGTGQDFSDQDLTKRDFSNKDLPGANFENADLIEANLQGLRAINASFVGSDLSSANLRDADLTGSDLRKAKLKNPSTWDANMTGANLEGQDLALVLLGRVNLKNANLRNLKGIASCETCDFRGADFCGANLTGLTDYAIQTSKLSGAKYDRSTRFPKGFDPEAKEMVLVREAPAEKKTEKQEEKE